MFGAPAFDRPPEQFVVFSQNHDQVGNRAFGDRMPDHARPLAAMVTLLAPFTPMLWMGEEYGERAPFQFFTDHIDEEIATATREGRRREFASFATFADEVPDPQAVETFEASRLTRDEAPGMRGLYRALLALRRALGRVEAEPSFDEDAGWLRVRLGHGHELVCNLSDHEQTVTATDPTEIVLATHAGAALRDGAVVLPALGGAVVR
jgi:maltooligosyltrehalose trehalohydrolase